jgi:hypothetical protein
VHIRILLYVGRRTSSLESNLKKVWKSLATVLYCLLALDMGSLTVILNEPPLFQFAWTPSFLPQLLAPS